MSESAFNSTPSLGGARWRLCRAITPRRRVSVTLCRSCASKLSGGLGSTLVELIKEAAAMRGNKLTHGEYEAEATWSTRKFTPFVMQRISVAIQIAAASEIRQALGMSLALSAA